MSEISERMRRARQAWHEVGQFGFEIRRPTSEQLRLWRADPWSVVLGRCVVAWRGVKGSDLVADGGDQAAAFDAEDFVEWVADRPDVLNALAAEVIRRSAEHVKAIEATEKN